MASKKTAKKTVSPVAAAAGTTKKLERHPLSARFALPISDEERLALGLDMSKNGQHYDILLFEGKVLDGWERYMGCLQQGITPRFREFVGDDAAATAFGTNAIRRKLNTVQKALFGAEYYLYCEENGLSGQTSQKDIAKLACVSTNRLNDMIKLLRATSKDAKQAVSYLKSTPDVSATALQQMLVDCGVVELQKAPTPPSKKPNDDVSPGDDPDADLLGDDDTLLDATGGLDVDSLLGDDDDDATPALPKAGDKKGDKAPTAGSGLKSASIDDHRAKETPASAAATRFKGLTETERVDFVQFAWGYLRPALDKALKNGAVKWAPPFETPATVAANGIANMTDTADAIRTAAKTIRGGKATAKAKGKPAVGRSRATA
jgi:hypothetical protein